MYQYSDHLGNVRLSYTDTNKNDKIDVGEIIEENNYYPFGLAHSGYNEKNNTIAANYKYQYNGKEKQEELGFNVYDYGARNYDAAIGRWMNVDPLAEQAPNWTPYRYSFNNPVMYTDPTGLFETKFGAWWHKLWNGDDSSSDIMYNEERKEYYYTNHSSYEDESGNQGLNMSFIYNSIKGDAGRPVFEIEGKASIGLQVGVKTSWGRVEGGLITTDIGKTGWSNQEENNSGFYAEWGDGRGHNFGSVGASLFTKKLGLGLGVDYITPHMIPPGGDIAQYYANNGEAVGGFSFGPNSRYFWKAKSGTLLDDLGTAVRLRGKVNSNVVNHHTVDLLVGVKAILGIEGRVRIGFTGKK